MDLDHDTSKEVCTVLVLLVVHVVVAAVMVVVINRNCFQFFDTTGRALGLWRRRNPAAAVDVFFGSRVSMVSKT